MSHDCHNFCDMCQNHTSISHYCVRGLCYITMSHDLESVLQGTWAAAGSWTGVRIRDDTAGNGAPDNNQQHMSRRSHRSGFVT